MKPSVEQDLCELEHEEVYDSESEFIQQQCGEKNWECCPVSSVAINCQTTKIVMNSGSQLSEL